MVPPAVTSASTDGADRWSGRSTLRAISLPVARSRLLALVARCEGTPGEYARGIADPDEATHVGARATHRQQRDRPPRHRLHRRSGAIAATLCRAT